MGSVQGEHDSIVGQIGGGVVGGQGEQVTVGGHAVGKGHVGISIWRLHFIPSIRTFFTRCVGY